jgi:adenylylsulfate kinase
MIKREQKATNITVHKHHVTRDALEALHQHQGVTIWFTGLPASGKSTMANSVAVALHELGVSTYVLDGDNIRHGLNKNLGFSPQDRAENIWRIGEVAKLFSEAGIVNLTAFISPYAADRQIVRELQPESFVEVHCAANLSVCEDRDPKGLYKKARAGTIKDFTGIDAPYQAPDHPEISIDTGAMSVQECTKQIVAYLRKNGSIPS